MKKTLRFSILSLLLMLCGTAMATDITFTAGTEVGTQTNAGDGADQMSKDGITISVTKGALAAAQYRFAKGETMTITSTVGNITKVEFTCTASGEEKYGPGNFTDVSSGTYSFEGNVGTWTGDAPEFSMIASKNQVRATTIVVTVNGSAPVQTKANKPVITPNGGTFEESIEYFDRRSEDLLYNYTAPQPPFIYNTILVNVGTTKNTGLEVSLEYDVLSKSALKWTTGVNWSTGDTKLTKLSSDAYQMAYLDLYRKPGVGTNEYFFRVEEGGKIGQFYGYEHAGIDENGLLLVYDNDGNAKPAAQADPSWKRDIGNGAPKHFLSWSNSFRYKNWDLSTLFRGAFGYKIFNMRKYGMGLIGCGTDNVLRTAYTDDADVLSSGGIISSYFLENGNYFKLDNVTLGYNYTPKNRQLVESLRVYVTAKNLFTLTSYKGNDPSIVTSTGITPGVDSNSAYPQATQLSLGVTVRFH